MSVCVSVIVSISVLCKKIAYFQCARKTIKDPIYKRRNLYQLSPTFPRSRGTKPDGVFFFFKLAPRALEILSAPSLFDAWRNTGAPPRAISQSQFGRIKKFPFFPELARPPPKIYDPAIHSVGFFFLPFSLFLSLSLSFHSRLFAPTPLFPSSPPPRSREPINTALFPPPRIPIARLFFALKPLSWSEINRSRSSD